MILAYVDPDKLLRLDLAKKPLELPGLLTRLGEIQ